MINDPGNDFLRRGSGSKVSPTVKKQTKGSGGEEEEAGRGSPFELSVVRVRGG